MKTHPYPLIVANWKMNGSKALADEIIQHAGPTPWICCPPATLLSYCASLSPTLLLGGQDCGQKPSGAFTGSLSAEQIREAGAFYVIVGHSERRQYQHETNADVAAKAEQALAAGLTPIICIGESLKTFESGETIPFLLDQLRACMVNLPGDFIIAYEPLWAIGSGKTPTVDQIAHIHQALKQQIPNCPLLYGGSVSAANLNDILRIPNVDGVLVGGASLKPAEFKAMLEIAKEII